MRKDSSTIEQNESIEIPKKKHFESSQESNDQNIFARLAKAQEQKRIEDLKYSNKKSNFNPFQTKQSDKALSLGFVNFAKRKF